ncbi:Fic family protein [Aromatoleum bremense]|uniref:Fic family protein n=2 Tax=Aromatoleum bremense TaxID=76115 RepID=A0ABX1NRL9_9RHOO|nr:Fic family protein [Aromatoleum bremense]
MKLPMNPPGTEKLMSRVGPERLSRVLTHTSPLPDGKYLHWDELRHRNPPSGLSTEEWWLSVWLARRSMLQKLPFIDKAGTPFMLATPEPVLIHLHHIDRDAAGQIRTPEAAPIHENRERYLLHSLIEESITSSQLEGASTTRRVAEAMLREGRQPRDRSEAMIFNNYQAMEHIRSLRSEPITPDRVLELHRMLTRDTLDDPVDAGRLRVADDVNVVDNRDGALLHEPPSYKELPERLERLCAFANAAEDSSPFVHPVVRAILLHFMIGYDHPFADGNGRTARALFYWSMARSGYWLMEFLSISQFLRRAPRQYVQAYLHTETDRNDTTYFVLHQLDIIRRSILALHEYLARKTQEQKEAANMLASGGILRSALNHRQLALLTHALRHPGEAYRVAKHQSVHNVVYQTARADLLDLEILGLLEKAKQGNAFVFYPVADLNKRIESLSKANR